MKPILLSTLAVALTVGSVSWADTWDKKTDITVHETILVPGKQLPPGKYVMKLLDVAGNRHVVQIFNEDQTKLQTTILAFPNYRVQPEPDTVLTFWETPSGSPPALRSWFFPGDNYGQEFAYPKEMAERIARANNNATVAQYEESAALEPDRIAELDVENEPDASTAQAQNQEQTEALKQRSSSSDAGQAGRERAANQQPQDPIQRAPQPSPARNSNTVTAQNAPVPRPLPDSPAPNTPAQQQPGEIGELPRTASPMPGVLLAGLAAFAGAWALRRRQGAKETLPTRNA